MMLMMLSPVSGRWTLEREMQELLDGMSRLQEMHAQIEECVRDGKMTEEAARRKLQMIREQQKKLQDELRKMADERRKMAEDMKRA
jgi:dsDNA-specific endonuclease/ATPase MutS2